jgi:sulfur carrier protein ThiS
MNFLRIVTAMAWADGQLEADEIRIMLDEFAELFAKSDADKPTLRRSLREYLEQNVPIEELVPQLAGEEERKLVLRLVYQVIQASRRRPDEPLVNMDEAAAYQRLVRILELPKETVAEIESSVIPPEESVGGGIIKNLAAKLHRLIQP